MYQKPKVIGIVGSRAYTPETTQLVSTEVTKLLKSLDPTKFLVCSGGAPSGADAVVKTYCSNHKELGYLEAVAFWSNSNKVRYTPKTSENFKRDFDRSAGFKRNRTVVLASDYVAVFWDGVSHGSKSVIELCKATDVPCRVYLLDFAHPLDKLELPKRPPCNTQS